MAQKFKNSKFRHIMGREWKRENWYPDLRPNAGASDATGLACSTTHIAVNWASTAGAVIALLDRVRTGKRTAEPPLIHAHSGPLSDMSFSPFDPSVLATASDDATVKLWRVGADGSAPSTPGATLQGHKKRVDAIAFHPSCASLLASASSDKTVRVWDMTATAEPVTTLTCFGDGVLSAAWNWTGALLATTAKDKRLRVLDPRAAGEAALTADTQAHEGTKPSRATWAGRNEHVILTTGFDRTQGRQFAFWDARALSKPARMATLPSSSGATVALYDGDSDLFFLAGKGEGAVRAYEGADADPWFSEITTVSSDQVCRAACLVPKTALNLMANEVDQVLKLTSNAIVPIGFHVPRQRRTFQPDLYPPTPGAPSVASAQEWLSGKTAPPKLEPISEPSDDYQEESPSSSPAPAPAASSPASVSPSTSPAPAPAARALPAAKPSARWSPAPAQSPPPAQKKTIAPIVRYTKFRHIAGKPFMQNTFWQDIRVNPNPQSLIRCNPTYVAVPSAGPGGRVLVWPLNAPGGRLGDAPWVEHGSEVVDMEFDPFDDSLLATAGEDTHVRIWRMPQGGLKSIMKTPEVDLAVAPRRICTLNFHPAARGLLVTSALDGAVRFWDVAKQQEAMSISGCHEDAIINIAWDWTGAHMATACRDKKLRIFDPRNNSSSATGETVAHDGAKGFRVIWAGRRQQLFTCGHSKASERMCSLWDARNLAKPLATKLLDSMSGPLTPYYDADTDVVFMVGRGDGNVRFFEVTQEDPFLHMLTEYSSTTQFADLDLMPKTSCDVRGCELFQVVRLTGSPPSAVERISFNVPRTRMEFFQDDIFPPTKSRDPKDVATAEEWLSGKNRDPVLKSLKPSGMTNLSEAPALDRGPAKYHMPTESERVKDLTRDEVFDRFFDKMQTKKEQDGPGENAAKEQRKKENEQGLGVADDEWDDS